jgi:soluble lytic murein transglycosylase-like protein
MMPKTYAVSDSRAFRSLSRLASRHGMKAAIVVLGAVVAAGTVNQTNYLPRTKLVQRVVAAAPSNQVKPEATVASSLLSRTPSSRVAPGGLDAGLEHERIAYWVNQLSTTLSGGFERSLGRMSKYADMITAKLDAKKAPRDLIYLAMIESNFNPQAKSPMKAVGLWQFMTGTARRFGLTVSGKVDERKDPVRATDAAIAYLSKLHDRFGSWYLAAAAYNSGEGTVLRALQRVTGRSKGTDEDFFRILPALPRETQDYVPKLIAAARVGNAPDAYGLAPKQVRSASAE